VSTGFLVTTLVVVMTPGTGALYTLVAGLTRGARAGLIAAIGCTLGIVPHMIVAITGLAALLRASGPAFDILKYLGVAYLLYMAWRTWRDESALSPEATASPPATRVIVNGVLINLLNPKLTVFFFVFLPLFVSASDSSAFLHMLGLSVVFMLVTLLVFAGYGVSAASVRNHVISRPRAMTWVRRVFAGSFVALGAKLAFTSR
jgi:threonine/homoserine/homoserine lactone efflux protein